MYEKIIVDTSALYALASASDNNHDRAHLLYENLIDMKSELFITSYIFVETEALIHRRLGYKVLKELVNSMKDMLTILWIESSIHNEAWKQIELKEGKGLSFVDWTTVVVARKLNTPVFAFDEDFHETGITVVY